MLQSSARGWEPSLPVLSVVGWQGLCSVYVPLASSLLYMESPLSLTGFSKPYTHPSLCASPDVLDLLKKGLKKMRGHVHQGEKTVFFEHYYPKAKGTI